MFTQIPTLPPLEDMRCPIWPDFRAIGRENYGGLMYVESDRAGGNYHVTPEAKEELEAEIAFEIPGLEPSKSPKINNDDRVNLTSWIVEQLILADLVSPVVTSDTLASIWSRRRLAVPERADRLLRLIAIQTAQIGQTLRFDSTRTPITPNYQRALAWSESSDIGEVNFLIEHLVERNFLHNSPIPAGYHCRLTVEGHAEIARQPVATDSSQAFVAMWFDSSMNDARRKAIEPAIREAGYDPVVID